MSDYLIQETGGQLRLEDGTGSLLLETSVAVTYYTGGRIEQPVTGHIARPREGTIS